MHRSGAGGYRFPTFTERTKDEGDGDGLVQQIRAVKSNVIPEFNGINEESGDNRYNFMGTRSFRQDIPHVVHGDSGLSEVDIPNEIRQDGWFLPVIPSNSSENAARIIHNPREPRTEFSRLFRRPVRVESTASRSPMLANIRSRTAELHAALPRLAPQVVTANQSMTSPLLFINPNEMNAIELIGLIFGIILSKIFKYIFKQLSRLQDKIKITRQRFFALHNFEIANLNYFNPIRYIIYLLLPIIIILAILEILLGMVAYGFGLMLDKAPPFMYTFLQKVWKK